jgi:2-hydroxy-3-keto-5-methylthiopentenyl-1-phosphate phosphatase
MESRNIKLYVDFDGTVTRRDVGNEFFRHFGGELCDRIVSEYRGEKISTQECFRGEAAAMRPFSLDEARALLAQQKVDETPSPTAMRSVIGAVAASAILC